MSESLDDFPDAALTARENQKLRKIIRDQERMDWLWATGRIWVGYAAAIIATFYASWNYLVKVVKALAPS